LAGRSAARDPVVDEASKTGAYGSTLAITWDRGAPEEEAR